MRKYLFIYKTTLMESLQYMMNLLLGFTSFMLVIYVFLNLWEYIYADSTNLIEGYTMTQMLWYVIFTEIMWFGNSNRTLTRQMSEDIKSGSIAYGMNKPYNYLYFMIAKHFGEMTIKIVLYLIVGILLGTLFVGKLPGFLLIHLPLVAIVFFLGMLVNSVLRMTISLISFWIEDATPFHWIYDKFILVIGTLFPVEVFPVMFQSVIKRSPIFVITYGPAKLLIDFSQGMFYQVLVAQLSYLVLILWALAASTYGTSHIFFLGAYQLPDLIMNGKLDSFLVQPKNVLLSVISSGSSVAAIGDVLYGYLIILIVHMDLTMLLLFTYFTITGAIILTAMAVIGGSLSFYIVRGDIISGNIINTILHLSTYPDGIFKGIVRILLFTIVPVGLVNYLPIRVLIQWDFKLLLVITLFAALVCFLAFHLFYRGLKRYSSSNLMSART